MRKTKLDKQLEKILFEVYDKGVKHEDCNLTASIENVKQALRIHDVSGMCEHPWASVMGDGEMKPAKCLKCGKYI